MMNCRAVLDKLSAVDDGGLPAEEMLVLRAHLVECAQCGAAYRDISELRADLQAMPRPEPPPDLRGRMALALDAAEAAVAAGQTDRRTPWELAGPYLAAAAVIAIAFALATVLSRPRIGGQVARGPAPLTQPTGSVPGTAGALTTGADEAKAGVPAQDPTAAEARAEAAARAANERIKDLQAKEAMKSRDGELLWPPGMELGPGLPEEAGTAGTSAPPEPDAMAWPRRSD